MWNLSQVTNHLIGTIAALTRALSGDQVEPTALAPDVTAATDHVGADALAAFDRATESFLAARPTDPAAMSEPRAMPMGEVPAGAVVNLVALDATVHGWDIGRASGQDPVIPTGLAQPLLVFARHFIRPAASGGIIGAKVGRRRRLADGPPGRLPGPPVLIRLTTGGQRVSSPGNA
ncbi:TIGR03086 family protein [Streptoalloteichus hindustanus]|uniref:TIGR03086 family protein n=1 Tax=Streptoalloteichus hindustanus TaxID=2017 RepID=A0A1M5Q2B6_STRHI|nr:TIGR03086 family protein [Streptoalloteichus hindustanus]